VSGAASRLLEPGAYTPLRDLQVLEVASHAAGSYCGKILGQLGAAVTRVDLPWTGYGRPEIIPVLRRELDQGKTAIEVTGAVREARTSRFDLAVFDSLADDRADGAARQASTLIRAACPDRTRIVEISDFGRGGHYASWPGSAIAAEAWTAMTWATGAPGREPLSLPGDLADFVTGAQAAGAAIAAVLDQSPESATSEVGTADVLGYITAMIVNNFIPYGRPWHRDGARATQSGGCYPGSIFQASDGPIMVMCRQQSEWDALKRAMGSPAWSADPRFADPREVARLHADEADGHLIPWVRAHSRSEVAQFGSEFGFPTAPVRSVGDAIRDPQFAFRGFFRTVPGEPGPYETPGTPWLIHQFPGTPAGAVARRLPGSEAGDKPLAGLRVLDLSWVWSGPMLTSMLADLGAEVIKVENPARPDPARARGPARENGAARPGPPLELSPYFNQLGHGKKSIIVDIASAGGRAVILDLAAHCDVVVENMRPGVLGRLGLGYEDLHRVNPRVVMLSMSMLGQEGPASRLMGYGMVMSGLAGLESLVGYGAETMGMFNLAISDPIAGSHGLAALLAAVHRQRADGESSWIDLSQTECTMAVLLGAELEAQLLGSVAVPGNGHTGLHPHGVLQAAGQDAWVAVAARSEAERGALRAMLAEAGQAGPADPDGPGLHDQLARWIRARDAEEAAAELRALGISASVVMSYEALDASGWFADRGFTRVIDHPFLGPRMIAAAPWTVGGRQTVPQSASPLLGEHTRDVLRNVLGYSEPRVEELAKAGVIGAAAAIRERQDA
jgi:crotonobetainyl-CoA:carnitine CoA-transferase CaiB-like acyl-CoA transferase